MRTNRIRLDRDNRELSLEDVGDRVWAERIYLDSCFVSWFVAWTNT